MRYAKIPLEKQLMSVADSHFAHPEYAPCAIRAMGEMPLAAYFGSTEEGKAQCRRLMQTLFLPAGTEWDTAYRDAAERIRFWKQGGRHKYRVETAVRLLAEPLAAGYGAWKKAWEEAQCHGQDTA